MSFRRIGRRSATLALLGLGAGLATAAPSFAVHQTVTGLVSGANSIVQFPVGSPQSLLNGAVPVTGVSGDLVGIDYRPRTGTLYGVSDGGQVYLLNPTPATPGTGPSEAAASFAATAIGTATTDPSDVASGLDFNPVPDAIRLVNEGDENYRISPNTGALLDGDAGTGGVQPDGNLAFAAADANAGDNPVVGAAGYTNAFDGATTTTLYDIEAGNDVLAVQNPPNAGTLGTVGALGLDVTAIAGLDIEPFTNNTPYAALQTQGDTASKFYRLSLTTGSAGTPLGTGGPFIGGATPQLVESVSLVPTSTLTFANAVSAVAEGGGEAKVVLTRVGPLSQQATVNYATSTATGDAATASADYTTTTGTLTFAPGDASETISVPVLDDAADEADEQFTITLTGPSKSANIAGAPPFTTKVAIVDNDDAVVVGNPGKAPVGLISVDTQKLDSSIEASFACSEACAAKLDLSLGSKAIDSQTAVQAGDSGITGVTFGLDKKELKKAKKKAKGKKSAKFSIAGTFADADGSTSSTVKFQLG